MKVAQSYLTLCNPMDCSPPGSPLSMGFSRQEYWSGLPFLSPGDLPKPGVVKESLFEMPIKDHITEIMEGGKPRVACGIL